MASLEQLVALNDEILALNRVGIPIQVGLHSLSADLEVASAQIDGVIRRQVERGVSLDEAIATELSLPSAYRGMAQVGLQCDRLPAGLELLSQLTQGAADARQAIWSALTYPLIICGFALLLLMWLCGRVGQVYADWDQMLGQSHWVSHAMSVLGNSIWGRLLPWLLAIGGYGLWRVFRRWDCFGMDWVPGLAGTARDFRYAAMADTLALLHKHQVAMATAVPLAAAATGHQLLHSPAQTPHRATNSLQTPGRQPAEPILQPSLETLPPFMRWAIMNAEQHQYETEPLELAAEIYRYRAESRIARFRRVAPVVTCVLIAGTVTLLYCLVTFLPLIHLMRSLA